MSTNYYLHSTDFAESVHIGASAGTRWTTDTSLTATSPRGPSWATTTELLAYLAMQEKREQPHPSWVADEYRRVFTPMEAADLILAHDAWRELDRAFS
jgi:hypothetical protein